MASNEKEYRKIFVRFLEEARSFSFSETSIPSPGLTQASVHCVPEDLLPGVKRLRREAETIIYYWG
jgi:hypothetical protein